MNLPFGKLMARKQTTNQVVAPDDTTSPPDAPRLPEPLVDRATHFSLSQPDVATLALTRGPWLSLVACAVAALVAVVAMVLAVRARADDRVATTLVNDDAVLADSAAEVESLSLQLQLAVTATALNPSDPTLAERYRAGHARLVEELRRARVHTENVNTKDVIDDLENRVLSYDASATRVFAATRAGEPAEARAALASLAQDTAQITELVDELNVAARTALDERGRALSGGGHALGMLMLALGAIAVALGSGAHAVARARGDAPALTPATERARATAWADEQHESLPDDEGFGLDMSDDEPYSAGAYRNTAFDGTSLDDPAFGAEADGLRSLPGLRAEPRVMAFGGMGDDDGQYEGIDDAFAPASPAADDEGDDVPPPIWQPKSFRAPAPSKDTAA